MRLITGGGGVDSSKQLHALRTLNQQESSQWNRIDPIDYKPGFGLRVNSSRMTFKVFVFVCLYIVVVVVALDMSHLC